MGQQLFKKRKKKKRTKKERNLSRIVCTGKELFTSLWHIWHVSGYGSLSMDVDNQVELH